MPKLSELLGGLITDVTQARVTADLATRQYADLYARDPLLSRFPVPRVTVREVTLSMKFAVAQYKELDFQKIDLNSVHLLWKNRLQKAVLLDTFGAAIHPQKLSAATIEHLQAALRKVDDPSFDFGTALAGDTRLLLSKSANYIVAAKKELPPDQRRLFPTVAELGRFARSSAMRELKDNMSRMRQIAIARQASELDLQVLVKETDLAEVPESQLSEFSLTLVMDDVEVLAPQDGEELSED